MRNYLPKDHAEYNYRVYKNCLDKIKTTSCWSGLDTVTLNSWLNNFLGDEQKFFAHRLLDLFIYRSEPHIYSLLQTFFYQTIPSVLQRNGYSEKEVASLLKQLAQFKGRLKIALNIDVNDYTSSASELGRRIKTNFWVHESNIIGLGKVSKLPKSCVVIIVDDFCGTGKQAKTAVTKHIKEKNREIYLCPLVMHSDALSILRNELVSTGKIKDFECTELIDDKYNIFSKDSKSFKWRNVSYHSEYRQIYNEIIDKKLPSLSEKFRYGHEQQALIFSFHYRCPNNCIPLIWHSNDNWSPLIRR